MRQNRIVLVSLVCLVILFCTSQVSAKRLYSWGSATDISLDVGSRTLHSYDGFDYVYQPFFSLFSKLTRYKYAQFI